MSITLVDKDLPVKWYNAAIQGGITGVDIETTGLNRTSDTIATVQIYVPSMGTVMIRNFAAVPTRLLRFLEHKKARKVLHFAPFDLAFLMRDYPMLQPANILDTKIAADILDPKRLLFIDPITQKGSHRLRTLVYHYFGYLMDKNIAVSNWLDPNLTAEQLEYAAKDVEYLPTLIATLHNELMERNSLSLAYQAYTDLPLKISLDLKTGGNSYEYRN